MHVFGMREEYPSAQSRINIALSICSCVFVWMCIFVRHIRTIWIYMYIGIVSCRCHSFALYQTMLCLLSIVSGLFVLLLFASYGKCRKNCSTLDIRVHVCVYVYECICCIALLCLSCAFFWIFNVCAWLWLRCCVIKMICRSRV